MITIADQSVPFCLLTTLFCRLKIEDDPRFGIDRLAAWACIRLDRLQNGVRFLKLYDAHGNMTDGLLLVRIEKVLR